MWHHEPGIVAHLRRRIMAVDFSWENVIETYTDVYRRIGARIAPVFPALPAVAEPEKVAGGMVAYKSSLPSVTVDQSAPVSKVAGKKAAPKTKKAAPKEEKSAAAPKKRAVKTAKPETPEPKPSKPPKTTKNKQKT
jgi:hypothetical protein